MNARCLCVVVVALAGCSDAPASLTHPSPAVPSGTTSAPPTTPPPSKTTSDALACGNTTAYTLEEEDTLSLAVACESGALAAVENLPDGASFDAGTGTVTWTPRLDQAGPFAFTFVGAKGERTAVHGMVLDRFDAEGNVLVTNVAEYREEYGLPVFHLTWHSAEPTYCQDDVDRDSVPADIVVDGKSYVGAELRCRGATSLTYPKKSFTLKFDKGDPFHGPPSLAAFEGRRRLVLTQTFDDNLQLRTRLAFELWKRLDPTHLRIDNASAIVFIDGKYNGLYQVTDNIGDHYLAARGLDKNANIYKSVTHAGNLRSEYNGVPKSPVWTGDEKSDGLPADDFADLSDLLTWITQSTEEAFAGEVDARLATDEFIDWYVFAIAIIANDSYGKNSYLIHDMDGPDTRFHYVPWDMNAAFGQDWKSDRVSFDSGGGRLDPSQLSWNGVWERLAADPTLTARLDARFAAALSGPASRAQVLARFDAMVEEVRKSAYRDDRKWDAARRAFPLWSTRTDFTTFDTEVAYVRTWIGARWDHLGTLWPPK